MALVINTNIASLQAQYALNKSQASLTTSLQRLSTGLRINSAKDDAAGFAISDGMTSQINGLNQAAQNANDGISLAQTAASGLQSMGDILQRMRQLAVQAANGTNTDSNRQDIQTEITQLYSEIDRISQTSQFNGLTLFSGQGATQPVTLQVGANAGQQLSFTLGEVDTKTLALNSTVPAGTMVSARLSGSTFSAGGNASSAGLVINGIHIQFGTSAAGTLGGGTSKLGTNQSLFSKVVTQINAYSGETGVTASAYNTVQGGVSTASATNIVHGLTLSVDGAAATTVQDASSLTQLVSNINEEVAGVTASIGQNNNLILSNTDGHTITIGGTVANSGLQAGTYQGFLSLTSTSGAAINVTNKSGSNVTGNNSLNSLGLNLTQGNGVVTTSGQLYSAGVYSIFSKNSGASAVYDPTKNANDVLNINGTLVGAATTRSAADMAAAINSVQGQTGVQASASTSIALGLNMSSASTDAIQINGATIKFSANWSSGGLAGIVTQINNSGLSGVVASADSATGRLVLSSASGVDIKVANSSLGGNGAASNLLAKAFLTPSSTTASGKAITAGAQADFFVARGSITLTGQNGASVQLDGSGTEGTTANPYSSSGLGKFGLVAENSQVNSGTGGVQSGLSVTTVQSATAAITAIDGAIQTLDTKQAVLGALQNRLTDTISNLQITAQNVTAAQSGIRDADFAAETANLTKAQILQQAGTAMLAQANSIPNNILTLLK